MSLSDQRQSLLGQLQVMLAPLDASILKPDFHLCLRQLECVCQIQSLRSDHVLLSLELCLQAFQLLRCENRTHSLVLERALLVRVWEGEGERKRGRERLLHCAPVNPLRQLTRLELVALKAQRRLLCVMLMQLLQTLQGGGRPAHSSSCSDGGGGCEILRSLMGVRMWMRMCMRMRVGHGGQVATAAVIITIEVIYTLASVVAAAVVAAKAITVVVVVAAYCIVVVIVVVAVALAVVVVLVESICRTAPQC